jgi:hypothetical protein
LFTRLVIGLMLLLICLVSFLAAMYQREAVKRELSQRACATIRIWWLPFASWFQRARTYFSVTYRDPNGQQHKARCYVYMSLMDSPFDQQRVEWTKDEVEDLVDI